MSLKVIAVAGMIAASILSASSQEATDNLGEKSGAAAGQVAGATAGTAVAGPIGSAVGGVVGQAVGSVVGKAADSKPKKCQPQEKPDRPRDEASLNDEKGNAPAGEKKCEQLTQNQ